MAEPIDAQLQELGDFLQRYRERSVHPVLWVGAGAALRLATRRWGSLSSSCALSSREWTSRALP